jgi:hypothetical protein
MGLSELWTESVQEPLHIKSDMMQYHDYSLKHEYKDFNSTWQK